MRIKTTEANFSDAVNPLQEWLISSPSECSPRDTVTWDERTLRHDFQKRLAVHKAVLLGGGFAITMPIPISSSSPRPA